MIARLDRLLGRVTMYALVLGALGVIAVTAEVLVLGGQLSYAPLAIPLSAAVLLAASALTHLIVGLITRTRPQLSSSLITALLLLFIFDPTVDPAALGVLAIASAVAVLSKYLLAVRGRHVFNPAAVSAFLVGLVFSTLPVNTFVSWWVGTPPMFIVSALAFVVVLFRTRRLLVGVVGVAAYAVVSVAVSAANGGAVLDGVSTASLSSPIVFFAAFMLSEPLTLPPRRWQQLAEALLVGALAGVPFSFGLVSSSPQLALLVGNVLAFFAGQRRGIRMVVTGRRQLTPSSWEIEFAPRVPVRFTPGQYVELALPHARSDARGGRRVFSIASAPGDGSRLTVATRVTTPPSTFKRRLLDLQPGDRVAATSVGGDFVLPANSAHPLLLVAGGIGITPFISQLVHLRESGDTRDVVLLYAVSTADDVAYAAELDAADCRVIVVSREEPGAVPDGWEWVTVERLTGDTVLTAVPDATTRTTYLSGPPRMVGDLRRALRTAGARRIRTDVFLGS
ncbi:MAG TPA: hypothetical protein VNT53_01125 [Pseudolysinimonas sp.]|nr:hypothetical protein [Pseudolysinimonas sp.]